MEWRGANFKQHLMSEQRHHVVRTHTCTSGFTNDHAHWSMKECRSNSLSMLSTTYRMARRPPQLASSSPPRTSTLPTAQSPTRPTIYLRQVPHPQCNLRIHHATRRRANLHIIAQHYKLDVQHRALPHSSHIDASAILPVAV